MATSDRRPADRRHARPLRRAGPAVRPREPLLRRGLRGAQGVRLPARHRARPSSAAPGSASTSTRSSVRRARLRRPGDGAGHQHALLLDGRGRRPAPGRRRLAAAGSSSRPPRARSSAPSTARPATTCRCCSPSPRADRVDGGWEISGHKIFGSLSPVWDYGGFHAMDTSDPEHPQIVHGFLPRDAAGLSRSSTPGTRSACGPPRARTPCSTRRSCPTSSWPLVCPAGFAGAGPFQVAIFAWALMGFVGDLPRRGQAGVRPDRRDACRSARRSP